MKWYWVIPICLLIVGWFGIFWTLNLSNVEVDINMDDNTLEAMKSIDWESMSNLAKETTCFIPLDVLQSNESYKIVVHNKEGCRFEEITETTGGSK